MLLCDGILEIDEIFLMTGMYLMPKITEIDEICEWMYIPMIKYIRELI